MTSFTPSKTDPAEMYALMGPDALMAHIRAATDQLKERLGDDFTPEAERGVMEIEECVDVYRARTNPTAHARYVRQLEAELAN